MAKPELSLIEERDETQRALGCVGLSAFAHVGLLIAILLAPSFKESAGVATGTTAGIELSGESIADAAPAGLPQASADSSAPVEVLLADANDPNAVALPNTPVAEEPAVKTADIAPVETQAIAKKPAVTKAKPAVESADIASALTQARKEAVKAPAKSVKAIALKAPTEAAAKTAPTEIAVAKEAVETSDAGDITASAQKNEASDAQPIANEQDAQAKNEALTATDTQANDDAAEAQTSAETQTAQPESKAAQEDEAVPLQVALPESESLTQAQANALQAPGANTNEIPADAKPIETVQSVRSNSAPTGMIVTRPANAAPLVAANTPATGATTGTLGGTGTTAGAVRGLPGSLGANGTVSGTTQSRGGTAGIGVPFGAQVRDARTLQAMPGNPLPTYPLPDRIANREGTTVLIGRVRNDGRIENVTLEKSSGSRLMDESAAKAFSQWKYRPGQEGYVRLPMQFKLVGDARMIPAQLNRQ